MPLNLQPTAAVRYNGTMATWEELEPTIIATLDDHDYDRPNVTPHPGAVLVAWEHYGPKQLALKGIEPGRRWSAICVVSAHEPPDEVDAEEALEIAIAYAEWAHPELQGQPLLVDVPGDYAEIRRALEDGANELANQDFVAGKSTLSSEDFGRLDELGYDSDSSYCIATAGDAVGVNGDLLVPSEWADVLALAPGQHAVQLWSEAATADGRSALSALHTWLREQGYQRERELGGDWPGGSETKIDKDVLVEHVAERQQVPEAIVERVADAWKGRYVPWGSSDGEIETYAKLKAKRRPRKTRR